MLVVLGHNSINDSKFSSWTTELQTLGLRWGTSQRTVSMPSDKVLKCIDRISVVRTGERSSKQQLQKLLGSLCHITMCLRSALPFFQSLQTVCTRLRPFQSVRLSDEAHRDPQWFRYILSDGHLDKLPLRFFCSLPRADINIYMDSSDDGLADLPPARNEFIPFRFNDEEIRLIQAADPSEFIINVRKQLCMALAAWCWGPGWQHDFNFPHVVCWSDNISAGSWINRFHSNNPFGQTINRDIGLAEAVFRL